MDARNAYDVLANTLSTLQNETGVLYVAMLKDLVNGTEDRAFKAGRKAGFDEGWELAGKVARDESDKFAELLLQVSAAMRGKDRADGPIDTTVYPDPAIYGWEPQVSTLPSR